MIRKLLTITLTLCTIGLLTSCDNSSDSIFGKLHKDYGELRETTMRNHISNIIKIVEDRYDVKKDEEELEKFKAKMQEELDKLNEKWSDKVDDMVGNVIPYTESDSLPYKIVSDITIEEVSLPEKGNQDNLDLYVTFKILIKDNDLSNLYLYYIIGDEEDDLSCSSFYTYASEHKIHSKTIDMGFYQSTEYYFEKGDTLTLHERIGLPVIPIKKIGDCKMLKFVPEKKYYSKKNEIYRQVLRYFGMEFDDYSEGTKTIIKRSVYI